ncbi:MAG: DUF1080 domain-containing protein [Planctomycetota bacterium]
MLAALTSALFLLPACAPQDPLGYTDTPKLPNSEWRVHDRDRPRPTVVTPAAVPEVPSKAPSDAVVLFDGSQSEGVLKGWRGRDGDAAWKLVEDCADHVAMEVNGTGDIQTRQEFGDVQLHLEFQTAAEVHGDSQHRGNSGVFFMGRYELQILDSFENPSYADGQCAALYGQTPPRVNACRRPGEWQTYDVVFRAPRFEDGELKSPAKITVLHNGVAVHIDQEFIGETAHRNVARYNAHAARGPIRLQDHGNPMRFRNIWVRPLED